MKPCDGANESIRGISCIAIKHFLNTQVKIVVDINRTHLLQRAPVQHVNRENGNV